MDFGSPFSGLFSSGGADPRDYHGPPTLRRARTPSERSVPTAAKVRAADNGTLSLRTFDENARYVPGAVLLDTPRSLRACSSLGISPKELLVPTLELIRNEMREAYENVDDENIVLMRLEFRIRGQQQKKKAVLEEYARVCESSDARHDAKTAIATTSMVNETRQLQKIIETNKSRLRQQLLRAQLLQKQREREDERLERQRQADLRKKQDAVKGMAERSRREEEAAALRGKAREIERQTQAEIAEESRHMYAEKDEQLRERMLERSEEMDRRNEERRMENKALRDRMLHQSELIREERRSRLQERMAAFEDDRARRQEQKAVERARKHAEAAAKEERIKETLSRCQKQQHARILKIESRTNQVESRLSEFAKDRQLMRMETLADEQEKEARRREVYEIALRQQQSRVDDLKSRMHKNEVLQGRLQSKKHRELSVKHEFIREKEISKMEAVNRQKRIEDNERNALMNHLDTKQERILNMKHHKAQMIVERRRHREEAERTRVRVDVVTPGPSDYVTTDGDVGTNRPQWKFGIPASAAGPRVILRSLPPPGYDVSPGPSAYTAVDANDARHRKHPSFSFAHSERFCDTVSEPTPGPQDYAPEASSPSRGSNMTRTM